MDGHSPTMGASHLSLFPLKDPFLDTLKRNSPSLLEGRNDMQHWGGARRTWRPWTHQKSSQDPCGNRRTKTPHKGNHHRVCKWWRGHRHSGIRKARKTLLFLPQTFTWRENMPWETEGKTLPSKKYRCKPWETSSFCHPVKISRKRNKF